MQGRVGSPAVREDRAEVARVGGLGGMGLNPAGPGRPPEDFGFHCERLAFLTPQAIAAVVPLLKAHSCSMEEGPRGGWEWQTMGVEIQ